MTQCSECGKEDMSFKCRYCSEKFCSEHRLPENHDCPGLEPALEKEKEETDKWFQKKEVKNEIGNGPAKKARKPSVIEDILNTFKTNYTLLIILFTSFIYFLQVSTSTAPGQGPMYDMFVLQSDLGELLTHPWSVVTAMFMHGSTFHLFANMITLYFFGTALERLIGGKDFLKFYFASGIIASLAFVAFRNLLYVIHGNPWALGTAVGASGAVVGVFAAVAMLYPRADILLFFVIPMKIKTGLYAFGGFETFMLILTLSGFEYWPFASSAHLAGLIVGVWFGKKLQKRYGSKSSFFNPLEV